MKLKLFSAVLSSAAIFFAACGSDSSSSSPSGPDSANSSSSVVAPGSSESNGENQGDPNNNPAQGESSSSVQTPVDNPDTPVSGNSGFDKSYAAVYTVDADGFVAIEEVYKKLGENDQVAFLVRHAEREADLGMESQLTESGVAAAVETGAKLAGDDAFDYASSGYVRTTKTCEKIAEGRGETAAVEAWEGLNGNWFVAVDSLEALAKTKGGTPTVVAKWVYSGMFADWFYEFDSRATQYINEIILPSMEGKHKVMVYCSHDLLVMPLVAFVSNKAIDMESYKSKRWLNYLAGIAIIKNGDSVRLVPIRGMESGIK